MTDFPHSGDGLPAGVLIPPTPVPAPAVDANTLARRIADEIEPRYQTGNYSCSGHVAKQWGAAYEGALRGLGVA